MMADCEVCGFRNTSFSLICSKCHSIMPKETPLKDAQEPQEEVSQDQNLKKDPPSILEKAKNFTKASVAHMADGFNNVSDEKKQQRMDICNACEFINKSNNTCNQCGCFLDVKTSWRTTSCPIGKWGPEEAKTENGIILPAYVNKPKKCKGCGKKS